VREAFSHVTKRIANKVRSYQEAARGTAGKSPDWGRAAPRKAKPAGAHPVREAFAHVTKSIAHRVRSYREAW
jgi:hypothetical protein